MGTTLTGTTPQDTYDSLIKVTDNGPLSGTAKYLSDGLGNDSALALSTANIGIGTTSPNLSGGASGSSILTISASASARNGILELNGTRTTLNDYVAYVRMFNNGAATPVADIAAIRGSSDTTGSLTLSTSNAERMRITSDGNVGIGTSGPTGGAKVHIASANGTTYAANPQLRISGNGVNNNVAQIVFSDDALSDAKISYFPSAAAAGQLLSLSARSTQADFQITGDGYVRLGSGMGGIQFNADTAAANALDDYEEGTYTPTLILGGGSVTYTTQTGTYTKIGRLVTLQIKIAVDVATTPSSTLEVAGLPFTISAGNKGAISAWAFGMTATSKVWVGEPTPSTNNIRIYTYDAGTLSNPAADLQNGCTLNITASYEV